MATGASSGFSCTPFSSSSLAISDGPSRLQPPPWSGFTPSAQPRAVHRRLQGDLARFAISSSCGSEQHVMSPVSNYAAHLVSGSGHLRFTAVSSHGLYGTLHIVDGSQENLSSACIITKVSHGTGAPSRPRGTRERYREPSPYPSKKHAYLPR